MVGALITMGGARNGKESTIYALGRHFPKKNVLRANACKRYIGNH
jgi:hypothetical protein